MREYLEELCDGIDAAVFSGDVLYSDDERKELAEYIARWSNAIGEHEAIAAAQQEQQAEPVAWQYRARLANGSIYGDWHGCSKQVHDRYKTGEFNGDLMFETRELYAQPPAVAGAVPDELTCEDIERLRSALSWEGYSTPESLESCAARWPSLVRDLISGVLDRKKRTLSAAQKGGA